MKIIDNEELKKIVNEIVENKEYVELVFDIVVKIIKLRKGKKVTIAKLIGYNSKEDIVDPLKQGTVFHNVKEVCKQLNIKLERVDNSFGGLAYFSGFKKI